MTEDRDQWADRLTGNPGGGWLSGFFADEDRLDRRGKLRLASWGVGAVGAVTLAILASQFSAQLRREQVASTDLLARQALQIQSVAKETQSDSRRLAAAIETLNSDRDRLFSRVTSVEQGLDSVTGAIKRQTVAPPSPTSTPVTLAVAPPTPAPAAVAEATAPQPLSLPPSIGPVASVPPAPVAVVKPNASVAPVKPAPVAIEPPAKASALISAMPMPAPLIAERSIMAPPDPAATAFSEPARDVFEKPEKTDKPEMTTASVQPAEAPTAPELPAIPVQRTEFGVDLGGANSVDGLRALWRGMVASNKSLSSLRPIIVLRERANGGGMQLRLVAGPLGDAAAAARLCATLGTGERSCETSVFEGQRLALKSDAAAKTESTATIPPAPAKPVAPIKRRRIAPVVEQRSEAPTPAPKPEEPAPKPQSSLTSILGLR